MAALVHRREQGVEVVHCVARRQSDVVLPEADLEGVDRQVEAERIPAGAHGFGELPRQAVLGVDRERAGEHVVAVGVACSATSAVSSGYLWRKDRAHVLGAEAPSSNSSSSTSCRSSPGPALRPAQPRLDHALGPGPERREIVVLARLHPGKAWYDSACACAISAASSVGTRVARSQLRRATRITHASGSSGGEAIAAQARRATHRSCRRPASRGRPPRASRAAVRARGRHEVASRPRRSQSSTPCALERSSISPSRSPSSTSAGCTAAHSIARERPPTGLCEGRAGPERSSSRWATPRRLRARSRLGLHRGGAAGAGRGRG